MSYTIRSVIKKHLFPACWAFSKLRQKLYNFIMKKHPMKAADQMFYDFFGRHIDWDNPKDINEKINWLKFHADPNEWAMLADKYLVREYVKNRGLEDTLIPLYGKWNTADEVLAAWADLPDEFVLKSNNGSGNLLIVTNKNVIDMKRLRKTLIQWIKDKNYGVSLAEPHYQLINNCIIAEKLLKDDSTESFSCSLVDYKIWCMDGKPYGCLVIWDRHIHGHYHLDWYDLEWNQHTELLTDHDTRFSIPKPDNWRYMLEIAGILSKGHPEVRVDLYSIKGKIYFGEMTFTDSGGYILDFSQELLKELGENVILDLSMPGNCFYEKSIKGGN